ncbi:M48 family metallopeptidase [Methylomonas sp. TEB]|uniref:M48 family metallopeptidase n=1 Tax=Methylomonas sp. TEB TaxID=3398229 RepID=UPI0039F63247
MALYQSDDLQFKVHTSAKRKSLGITVDRDGSLILHTPNNIVSDEIESFINEKRLWIYTKLAAKEFLNEQAHPERRFIDGEGFCYLGRTYRLALIDSRIQSLIFKSGRFYLAKSQQDSARALFIDWYKQKAMQRLPGLVSEFTSRLGVKANGLKVMELGNRWGSCSDNGVLNFHWKVMQLPQKLLRYIAAHEAAHLLEKHHSPEFWQTVERLIPNYIDLQATLQVDALKYARL